MLFFSLASYLPNPSSQEYEFVYIDANGEVCSHSSKFTFCAPKPLEDLVTLEEEHHGEEDGTDMLVVVPRAELLQVLIRHRTINTAVSCPHRQPHTYDPHPLPASLCLLSESSAGMPARAR